MSEKALITRAWKITNVSKLKSFVQVCWPLFYEPLKHIQHVI
jgi:hypothetical protein